MVLGSHRRRIKKPAGDECLATRMGRGLHLVPKICSNQNPIGAMAFWVALIWGKWFSSRLLQHQKLKAVLIWCWKTSTFRFATLSSHGKKELENWSSRPFFMQFHCGCISSCLHNLTAGRHQFDLGEKNPSYFAGFFPDSALKNPALL